MSPSFLISGPMRNSGLISSLSCSSSRTNHFSKDSFQWRMVLRSQHLDFMCVHCYWNITASRPSQQKDLGNKCMLINMHFYVYIHRNPYIYTDTSNSNPIPQGLFAFYIFNNLLQQWKIWVPFSSMYLLICSMGGNSKSSFKIANSHHRENKPARLMCLDSHC